jgi:hypothetical protein
VTDDLGLFARLAWRNGQPEIMQWTDIDRTASVGGLYKGTSWERPDDTIGLAAVVNGLSGSYEAFSQQAAMAPTLAMASLSIGRKASSKPSIPLA